MDFKWFNGITNRLPSLTNQKGISVNCRFGSLSESLGMEWRRTLKWVKEGRLFYFSPWEIHANNVYVLTDKSIDQLYFLLAFMS